MILFYAPLLLALLYYFYHRHYNYWKVKGIPFVPSVFIFGIFHKVIFRKEHILSPIRAMYLQFTSPYVGFFIFHQPQLLLRSPKLIKQVLIKDFDKFVNRNLAKNEAADPLAFHTLFIARDKIWRNMRSKFSPVFTPAKMKLMFPLMKECTQELCNYLDKTSGKIIDTRLVMKKFSTDIISSCAFGINSHCFKNDDSKIYDMSLELINTKRITRSLSILSYFFLPLFVNIFKLRFLDKTSSDFLCNLFHETLKKRQENQIERHDFLDILKNLRKTERITDDYKFDSEVKMAAQAIAFFTAGSDTTAITLAITLYEMALNKTIQNRLRQEIRESFDKNGDWTFEMICEMKYLDMVLKETLRKYPLAPFLNRTASMDYTLDDTGFIIEKGTSVMIPIIGLHYDPEYFPHPDKYDPERFRNENNIIPYTYLPFGDGPRNCIGKRFAMVALKLSLAALIKDFEFQITDQTNIPLRFDVGAIFVTSDGGIFLRHVRV